MGRASEDRPKSQSVRGAKLRILVVDDHSVVRKGVVELLKEEFPQAELGEAATPAEALQVVQRRPWDLILLDLTLPGRGGLDLLKDIRKEDTRVPVLVLTMHPEHQFASRAFAAGAAGYLTKMSSNALVIEAARKLLAGGRFVTPELAEKLAADLGVDTSRPPHELLSDREYEVFTMLASGRTVGEIAAEMNLSVQTISTYRARILEKMRLKNNAELMQYAVRNNLVE